MDPRFSAQDVLRCDLCETPVPPMYCDFCHVKLCKACVGEHLSDLSKEHKVVPYKEKGTSPKCPTHVGKLCELHCKECDLPVCSLCLSSKIHKGHNLLNLLEIMKIKQKAIQKDGDELCNVVYPKSVFSLFDEPELVTSIQTRQKPLFHVTCLSDEEIWTSGNTEFLKLYNLQGKLLKSIETEESYSYPGDIALTRSGDLVYTYPVTKTVNIVKNDQIQEVIRLRDWIPFYICSTSSGDLLVTMVSTVNFQSKVVRYYSNFTETQSIQFDNKGKRLYSYDRYKFISENRNLDICVADNRASAVVVVNQAGKLRFRYTGHPSTTKRSFDPLGITTDSQSQILIADYDNQCIHIIDQDGQFLRYIDNCDLHLPWGLCVDSRDNLFVAEFLSGKAKKIKYMYIQTMF
ncbi:uncharacterized protein LOC134267287 [Saccostrea cucullata]|uniref:uncharacterized protein LOC134267287 n=1 Tax=Saccostrea cuccullata TaxID=36930 RepID=UPI002ED2AFC1